MKIKDSSLWESYGFRDNPFDTSPLSIYPNHPLSINKAFIARSPDCQAMRLVTNLLRSSGGNRFVLEGPVGVGKTTFINFHKYIWENKATHKLFTPAREFSFSANLNIKYFLLNILSLLTTKILLLKGEKFIKKHPLLQELMLLHKVHSSKSYGIEAEVMGWGAGVSQNSNVSLPPIPEAQLLHYYQELVSFITDSMGYKGIILHFDNLELLGRESVKEARKIFDEIRDVLQVRHVYYIFVSQPNFFQQVIAPLPRVRSIFFGWPVILTPLSKQETIEAIHLRYELLAIPGVNTIRPVEDDFIDYLYDIYEGQIRFVMDAINAIVMHSPSLFPKTLQTKEAEPLLKSIVGQRVREVVSQKEWEILMIICNYSKFTNTEVSKATGIYPQNVNKYLQSLLEKGFICYLGKEGRQAFYRIAEDAKILQLFAKNGEIPPIDSQDEREKTSPLNQRQQLLLEDPPAQVTLKHYQQRMNVSYATASRDLKELQKLGYLSSWKDGKKIIYRLAEP